MQELFAALFWDNEEISHAAACLCEKIPGCRSAQAEYDKLVAQVQEIVGFELCNQLLEQLTEYSRYKEYAYYAVGLGLREQAVQWLEL